MTAGSATLGVRGLAEARGPQFPEISITRIVGSAYGAAGSLVVLIVWVYYSAQIFFFGAMFTRVYAQAHGWQPKAAPHSEKEDAQKHPVIPKRPSQRESRSEGTRGSSINHPRSWLRHGFYCSHSFWKESGVQSQPFDCR